MKRTGGLWKGLVSLDNLFAAAKAAARGKRFRPDVALFLMNLEDEIIELQAELESGSYLPGPYRTFIRKEKKRRMISAAPFRDRVIHHALTRIIEPIFERRFVPNSFACRKGFGTHKALNSAMDGCARFRYVLKCDVVKYFASIDHLLLNSLLARIIKCSSTLGLAAKIIDCSGDQENEFVYYHGDCLFTPVMRKHGLPLGNQTSQFFANVYLNPLDHFICRELQPERYVRYVDDFLLFTNDKKTLKSMREAITSFLCGFRLRIHDGKSRIFRTSDGITFLGWRIFPNRLKLVRENVVRFRLRLKAMQSGYAQGVYSIQDVKQRIMAWIGHAGFGNTWRLRTSILCDAVFRKGSAA